jgi:uncharacterized membrane protein
MRLSLRQTSVRTRLGFLALAPILMLFTLLLFFPPDGVERAEWAQFIGRFHLLVIHFPIALILLVPVLEIAGKSRRFGDLSASVDLILALATVSAIFAGLLGWCLARSGNYSGRLVTQHMWGGVFVAALCWLCWMLHGRFADRRSELIYACVLLVAVGLVSWTGYRGGQLSQGENHLTEYMPEELRDWLGLSFEDKGPSAASNTSFFAVRVQPVFAGHCYNCHGRSKQRSRLRLDSYEAVMRGGKHGAVVKAGNYQGSELFHRVTLPVSDDKAMPAEGKKPLSADEIKILQVWIAAGASPTLAADAIKDAPASVSPVVADVTFEEIDAAAVAKRRTPFAAAVAQLQKRFPNVLDYESRGSAELVLNVSLMGSKFGDEDMALLAPFAKQIVMADLSGTAITDRSANSIAGMKRLRVLRLMHTQITDATVQALSGLNQLESLNVFSTAVTPAALQMAASLPKLQHLYAGETRIPANVQVSEAVRRKLLF